MRKIKFYKSLLTEVLETLATICLYLASEASYNHNRQQKPLYSHYAKLKDYSKILRGKNDRVL
jgi:hypothetical protein